MADYTQNDKRPNGYIEAPENRHRQKFRNEQDPVPKHDRRPAVKKERNTFASGALICGILGMLNLCCFAFTTAIIFGVGAICFAIISKKENKLTKPARIAIILGTSAVLCGIAEYFYALKVIETIKDPANIAKFNQMLGEIETFLEEYTALEKTTTH